MNSDLLRLLQLTDPALPIGGFAHSAGLETYVQQGIVHDAKTADIFIRNMLSHNLHYTDAALMAIAYKATCQCDVNRLFYLDALCAAVKLPQEMREASAKLGARLLKIFEPLCSNDVSCLYNEAVRKKETSGNYCIVFGMYAPIMGIDREDALQGFYYNAAAGMVINSVKLVPLSQQSGQQILFSLQSLIKKLANENLHPDEDKIGTCCNGFDIKSMQHERLYSRLYMS